MKKCITILLMSVFLATTFLFSNTGFADDEKVENNKLEGLQKSANDFETAFLNTIKDVVGVGVVYASVGDLTSKTKLLSDCGMKYAEDNKYSQSFIQKNLDAANTRSLYDCITKTARHNEIKIDDVDLAEFGSDYWADFSDGSWYSFGKTVHNVPHPLLIIYKVAAEVGSYSFVKDGQIEFKVIIADGIKNILKRRSYASDSEIYLEEYNTAMKKVLLDLVKLFNSGESLWANKKEKEAQQEEGLPGTENIKAQEGSSTNSAVSIPYTHDMVGEEKIKAGREIARLLLSAMKRVSLGDEEATVLAVKTANAGIFERHQCDLKLKQLGMERVGKCEERTTRINGKIANVVYPVIDDFLKSGLGGDGLKSAKDKDANLDAVEDTMLDIFDLLISGEDYMEKRKARQDIYAKSDTDPFEERSKQLEKIVSSSANANFDPNAAL